MEEIKAIRPKKICFLEGDISRSGGTERVTADIANELSNHMDKYEIHILSLCNRNKINFFELNSNIITNVIFNTSSYSAKKDYFKIVYNIRNYINQHNIDVLIDVDTILDIFSIPATRFTNAKFIAWEHFNFYENLGVKYRDWGRKLSARFADAIITITNEDNGYFKKNMKLHCPVYTIYNPIILREINDEYDLNSKIIVSAGRLTHQKGFDMLVDVAKGVFCKHKDWKWIILGEGEDRELLEKKIIENGLQNNLVLIGNVENIGDYYKKAAMFVLTSRYEGFGLVLTEAKSYGLPCISFKCKAGPSEIILDNINGNLIDCFDITEMSNKICDLIENPNKRKIFSQHALDDTGKFLKNDIINAWIELLDDI